VFENRVLRRIFRLKRDKVTGSEENYIKFMFLKKEHSVYLHERVVVLLNPVRVRGILR
jgi:hypothetical protein